MRGLVIFFSLLVVFWLQQVLNIPGFSSYFNFLPILAILYFTSKDPLETFLIAGFVGLLYDATSSNFFGSYIIIFLVTCYLIRLLVKNYFPINVNFSNAVVIGFVGLVIIGLGKMILFSIPWLSGGDPLSVVIQSLNFWVLVERALLLILSFLIVYLIWYLVNNIKTKKSLNSNGLI